MKKSTAAAGCFYGLLADGKIKKDRLPDTHTDMDGGKDGMDPARYRRFLDSSAYDDMR